MTKQELQDKIHEAGFEPPMCYSEHSADGVTQRILYPAKDFCDDGMSPFIPYYPCEWLWERLPCSIRGADECWYFLKLGRYWGVYAREGRDSDSLVEVPTENDLHQALLELFVWCIENNHIKL